MSKHKQKTNKQTNKKASLKESSIQKPLQLPPWWGRGESLVTMLYRAVSDMQSRFTSVYHAAATLENYKSYTRLTLVENVTQFIGAKERKKDRSQRTISPLLTPFA